MPDFLGSTTLDAQGFGVVRVKHNNAAAVWVVEQVTANVFPSSTAGALGVFKNGNPIGPAGVLAPMTTPTGVTQISQTFAGEPFVPLGASDELEVVVSGATASDQVTVRAQYREYPVGAPEVIGVYGVS